MGYPYRYFSAKLIRGFIWDIPIVIFAYVLFWALLNLKSPTPSPVLGPKLLGLGPKASRNRFECLVVGGNRSLESEGLRI